MYYSGKMTDADDNWSKADDHNPSWEMTIVRIAFELLNKKARQICIYFGTTNPGNRDISNYKEALAFLL